MTDAAKKVLVCDWCSKVIDSSLLLGGATHAEGTGTCPGRVHFQDTGNEINPSEIQGRKIPVDFEANRDAWDTRRSLYEEAPALKLFVGELTAALEGTALATSEDGRPCWCQGGKSHSKACETARLALSRAKGTHASIQA